MSFALLASLLIATAPAGPTQSAAQAPLGPVTDIGGTDRLTFFVVGDPAPQAGRSTIWVWQVYYEPVDVAGAPIDARAERLQIDCSAGTMLRTRWENYSGARMQAGGDMNSGTLAAAPGNETERMVAVGCGQPYPGKGQGQRFDTIEAAIQGIR